MIKHPESKDDCHHLWLWSLAKAVAPPSKTVTFVAFLFAGKSTFARSTYTFMKYIYSVPKYHPRLWLGIICCEKNSWWPILWLKAERSSAVLLGREGVWLCWAGKLAGLLVEGTVPSWASRRDRDLASRIGLGHQPLLLLLGLPALRSAEQHMLTLLSMLS